MYCSQCGEVLSKGDRFCVNCGAPVIEESDSIHQPEKVININPTKSANQSSQTNINKRKGLSGAKGILIVVLALVLAAGGFWGWKSYGNPEVRAQKKLDIAIKFVSENNYEQALLAYNEAIQINPKDVQAYQGLAKVYTLQGNFENAQSTYDQGLKTVKADNKIKLELGLAALFIDKKDYTEALNRFQQLINKDKSNIDAYRGLALVYQTQNKLDQARAVLQQCIAANPDDYRAYNAMADNETYYDAAQSYIAKSLDLEMNQHEAYAVLNRVYNPKDSNSDFWVAALSKSSISPTAVPMLRFYAYYRDGKFDKALAEYHSNIENNPTNLKARAMAVICMVKTGDTAGAAKMITEVEKSKLYDVVQMDVAYYYSLINQTDKAKALADKVLKGANPDLGAIQIAAQILGNDSPNVQIAAAKYITQQWLPIVNTVPKLQQVGVQTSVALPTSDPIEFIKNNYPDLKNLGDYRTINLELTGDNLPETVVFSESTWAQAFVLKRHGNSYQIMYHDDYGHYGYKQPTTDKYYDLYITGASGGTGNLVEKTVVLRWDGNQLREIWSCDTKNHNDATLPGTSIIDEQGTFSVAGASQPEKLTYILNGQYGHYTSDGQKVWDKAETVTKEYTFDTSQFKFVESSSKTDSKPLNNQVAVQNNANTGGDSGDPKLAVLKASQAYFEKTTGRPVYLAPPYGNPPPRSYVVVLSDFQTNTASILMGEYETSNAGIHLFKKNASGQWVYDHLIDENDEGW